MGKDPSQKKQSHGIGAGTTSTGVYVDADTGYDDPQGRSAASIRREALRRAVRSGKQAKRRKGSPYRRKQLRSALTTAVVVLASAVFSLLIGDSLWSPSESPVAVAAIAAQPATTATQASPTVTPTVAPPSPSPTPSPPPSETPPPTAEPVPAAQAAQEEIRVFVPKSGSRYHLTATCSNMQDAQEVPLQEAKARGFTACKRCNPPE